MHAVFHIQMGNLSNSVLITKQEVHFKAGKYGGMNQSHSDKACQFTVPVCLLSFMKCPGKYTNAELWLKHTWVGDLQNNWTLLVDRLRNGRLDEQ